MTNWQYTYTDDVQQNLSRTTDLVRDLLLSPNSPRKDLELNWQATIDRIHAIGNLSGTQLSKTQVIKALNHPNKSSHKLATNLHNTLHHIKYQATTRPDSLTDKSLKDLFHHLTKGMLSSYQFRSSSPEPETNIKLDHPKANLIEPQLKSLLSEINNAGRIHPTITIAAAHARMLHLSPFPSHNHLFALVFAHQVSFRYTFAFRIHAPIEPLFLKYPKNYTKALASTKTGNLTRWLDFYSSMNTKALQTAANQTQHTIPDTPKHTSLSDRQLQILTVFDNPNTSISNKKIASRFRISPITASRDLSRLRAIGLITQIGKGRSTTYRKI